MKMEMGGMEMGDGDGGMEMGGDEDWEMESR